MTDELEKLQRKGTRPTCPICHATVLSTSQPNRMGTTPELQKLYDQFGGEPVAWRWRTLPKFSEDAADQEWELTPTAPNFINPHHHEVQPLYAALAATPAVGGEATVDAVRQTIADEWGSFICWKELVSGLRICDKDKHCRCADIARAVLGAHSFASPPEQPAAASASMLADIAQIIDAGWKSGQSVAEVAAEILREFDGPAVTSTECGMERPSTSAMHDLICAIIEDDAKYDATTNTWDTSKAATAIIAAFDGEPTALPSTDCAKER